VNPPARLQVASALLRPRQLDQQPEHGQRAIVRRLLCARGLLVLVRPVATRANLAPEWIGLY
jgi:hypothetical protein